MIINATLEREILQLQLRDYQVNAVDFVRNFFRNNPAPAMPVAVAGCGAGKTVIFAQMAWLSFEKGNTSMIICPYQSLLDQFLVTLIYKGFKGTKEMYEIVLKNDPELKNPLTKKAKEIYDRACKTKIWKPEIAWYAGGKPTCKDYTGIKVFITMAQTIESRGFPNIPISLIGYDEWHLTYFRRELQAQLNNWKYYNKCREVGFTATPYHSDGRKAPHGTALHTVITTKELIKTGFNSPYVYMPLGIVAKKYAIKSTDLTYQEEKALLHEMFPPEKSWAFLSDPETHLENNPEFKAKLQTFGIDRLNSVFDERTVFFFSRKAIAQEYMDYYREELIKLGIHKELIMVCDETPMKERSIASQKFRRQEAILFTVTALAVGFDEPSVENIVLHRPFTDESFALFVQIIGRCLRVSPATGKRLAKIYAMCNNPHHLLPDEITDWNIPESKELQKLCRLPIPKEGKTCEHCGTVNGRNMKHCYKCGEKLPAARQKTDEEKFEEWQKLVSAYTQDREGVFTIDDILLAKVRDLLIVINEQFNTFEFDNQETKAKFFECLVSLQRAVKGFIFHNDPLPVERLQSQSILLSQLTHLNLMPDDPVLNLVVDFKKAVDKFLLDGEASMADRFLAESKEAIGTTNVLKFVERASLAGQSSETVYKILLKLAVLLYDYNPNWSYYEFKKLFPDYGNPPVSWKRHAIFGESPTYGNYLFYHHFLWTKYGKKYGDNAHTQVFSALAAEFGKYSSQFYAQFQKEVQSSQQYVA